MRRRKIAKIPSAVSTLSRRVEYLDGRLEERSDELRRRGLTESEIEKDKGRQFDKRESAALHIAIDAMNLAQLFQRVESDPIALLEELVDAVDRFRQCDHVRGSHEHDEVRGNLLEVVARVKSTIALADAFLDPGEAA